MTEAQAYRIAKKHMDREGKISWRKLVKILMKRKP